MKILMICSVLREGIGKYFDLKEQSAGGWIDGIINGLKKFDDINLTYVVFFKSNKNELISKKIYEVNYTIINYKNKLIINNYFKDNSFDIIHLFGAEHKYIKDIYEFLDYNKTLVYIQGIISEYAYYYFANYNQYNNYLNPLFSMYLAFNKKNLMKQGAIEKEVYSRSKYITGRTDWDRSVLQKLGYNGKYFHLNETLRREFYKNINTWSLNKVNRRTVFISQTNYPIKAAHMVVEIAKILKEKYCDIKFYIAGHNLSKSNTLPTRLRFSYANFIMGLIKSNGLNNNIKYVGNLNQNEIINYLQKSNVFLLSSSIENSPNSLQEAMCIGTPIVCSFVGGVSTIVKNSNQGKLYPFEDPSQAAYYISQIIDDDNLAISLSMQANKRILELIDIEKNSEVLYDIYNYIFHNEG